MSYVHRPQARGYYTLSKYCMNRKEYAAVLENAHSSAAKIGTPFNACTTQKILSLPLTLKTEVKAPLLVIVRHHNYSFCFPAVEGKGVLWNSHEKKWDHTDHVTLFAIQLSTSQGQIKVLRLNELVLSKAVGHGAYPSRSSSEQASGLGALLSRNLLRVPA